MGMVISFNRVTPEELDRAENDPEWASEFLDELDDKRPDDPDGYLDKAWAGIQYLLDAASAGVELQDGYSIDDEGTLQGWTVEDVQAAAKKLRALPFERLAAHYDPAQMTEEKVYPDVWDVDADGELEYLRWHYEKLVKFFDAAAATGSAAIMTFSG